MKRLLFPIILIACVVLGGVSADFVKYGGEGDAAYSDKGAHNTKAKDKHGKKDKESHGKKSKSDKKDSKKKADSHGKDKATKNSKKKEKSKDGHGKSDAYDDGAGTVSYLKFKRHFVVPVMKNGTIEALVIMNINLLLNENAPDQTYNLEPKVRDALMRNLMGLSNQGAFGNSLTNAENFENIRLELLKAAKSVLSDSVDDVLILDIARQER